MAVKRTNHRITTVIWELEGLYGLKRDSLPDRMELLPDGIYVAIYLTEEEFKERQGLLFPRCPITGAYCNWDPDYEALGDLF